MRSISTIPYAIVRRWTNNEIRALNIMVSGGNPSFIQWLSIKSWSAGAWCTHKFFDKVTKGEVLQIIWSEINGDGMPLCPMAVPKPEDQKARYILKDMFATCVRAVRTVQCLHDRRGREPDQPEKTVN